MMLNGKETKRINRIKTTPNKTEQNAYDGEDSVQNNKKDKMSTTS